MPPARRSHRLGARALTVLAITGLTLLGVEVLLRASGRGPWQRLPAHGHEPVMFEPDPVLGWRSRPGRYEFPGYTPNAPPVRMSYGPDGARATGAAPEAGERVFLLLGGSVTQGWGLSDEDTFSWKLQRQLPSARVKNFGTGGYSTYQSLLLLERTLPADARGVHVLYGFIVPHEFKNVATREWLDSLARTSRSGMVAVPYASLRDGDLVRHPPERHPAWPLHDRLATAAFLEGVHAQVRTAGRAEQARKVTWRLIHAMARFSRDRGADFSVLLLWLDLEARPQYVSFLRATGIDFIDCAFNIPARRRIPGEGHPDAVHNTRLARCLGAGLAAREADGDGSRDGVPASPSTPDPDLG